MNYHEEMFCKLDKTGGTKKGFWSSKEFGNRYKRIFLLSKTAVVGFGFNIYATIPTETKKYL